MTAFCTDILLYITNILSYYPQTSKQAATDPVMKAKHKTTAIRLSNNLITDWSDFSTTVAEIIEDPSKLEWIDLSFNDIYNIDKVSFYETTLH